MIGPIRARAVVGQKLYEAAKVFRENLNCYTQGMSVLAEEDVKILDEQLSKVFEEWEKIAQ